MADFDIAFAKTKRHEGGYANDPDDAGGETYMGIARRYHPTWAGWVYVDMVTSAIGTDDHKEIDAELGRNLEVQRLVRVFYKDHFWDAFWGDEILDQRVANELFDTGVNVGVGRAVLFLQKSLNKLNMNGKLYPDLVEDGAMGPKTLMTLTRYVRASMAPMEWPASRTVDLLLKVMNVYQGMHYLDYMDKSPVQEKFATTWFSRVSIEKEPV